MYEVDREYVETKIYEAMHYRNYQLNLDKINSIFNNRKKWVDETNIGIPHYPNPLKVYDEYLKYQGK